MWVMLHLREISRTRQSQKMFRCAIFATALAVCEALVATNLATSFATHRAIVLHRTSLVRLQSTDEVDAAPEDEVETAAAEAPPPAKPSGGATAGSAGFFDGTTTVGTKTIPYPPAVLVVGVSVGFCVFVEVVKAVKAAITGEG